MCDAEKGDVVMLKGGDCLVCYGSFRTEGPHTPVLFQCGHSICRKCSETLPQEKPGKNISHGRVKCPSCFSYSPTPLVKNFELINLLDANGGNHLLSASAACSSEKCENCTSHQSRIYCITCVVSFCEECDALFHRSAAMSRHSRTTIPPTISSQSSKAHVDSLRGARPLCGKHPGEPLKLVCESCFCLVCRDCVDFGQHRGHDVRLIAHAAADYRQRLVALVPHARSLVSSLETFVGTHAACPSPIHDTHAQLPPPVLGRPPPCTPESPPHASETDASPSTAQAILPPAPPDRLPEKDLAATAASSSTSATDMIKSHFALLRAEIDRREQELLLGVQMCVNSRSQRHSAFLDSVRNVIAKVETSRRAAERLAVGDDSSLCVQYKSVASDLEAALLSPLAEEDCAGNTLMELSGELTDVSVTLPPYPLLAVIKQHGAVGPPPVPVDIHCILAARMLSADEGVLAEELLSGSAGRVIISWSQLHSRNNNDAVKFRIQRGVCDNLPGPCRYTPTAAALGTVRRAGSQWGIEEESDTCSVGPSSTPMETAVERNFDGNTLSEGTGRAASVVRSVQREIGRLMVFETIGEVHVSCKGNDITAENGLERCDKSVDEVGEEISDDVLHIHGRQHFLLTSLCSDSAAATQPRWEDSGSDAGTADETYSIDGRSADARDLHAQPLMRCVSTPSAAPDLLADSVEVKRWANGTVLPSSGQATEQSMIENSLVDAGGFAFVSDVSHFAAHVVHFRVQAVDATGAASAWSASSCLLVPPFFQKCFPPPPSALNMTNSTQCSSHDPFRRLHDAAVESESSHSDSVCRRGGALYFLGTKRGSERSYTNPHLAGIVRASMSSVVGPDVSRPERFVDHEAVAYSYTGGSSSGQWMAVDLGEKSRMAVTHYAIRTSQVNRMCQWEFQARVDACESSPWITLHRNLHGLHPAGCSQDDPYVEAIFAVLRGDPCGPGALGAEEHTGDGSSHGGVYQCFRILQTGANSSGTHNLFCSGIELYGTLHHGS